MILTKTHYLIILFLLSFTFSFSQKKVTGTIVDENNMPLPGVNVLIKDTTTGTMTDFDGLYEIELSANENVLTFSMVGMITQTVTVGEQTQFDIVLKSDITQLDEVVVVGYGTVARKDLTGAVSTVKSEDIELAPVANFDQALAGRIAGVTVTSGEGTPGAALNIVVRGGNSITGSNAPLYVINGIPLEDFDPSTINPSDIKSFNVLKDASATAIYGSRGANGVIVITTKEGQTDGKSIVTFNHSTALSMVPKYLDVLSPYEYVKHLETRAISEDNWIIRPNDPSSNLSNFYNRWGLPELYVNAKGTDWQDEIFQTALMTNTNFSISGGNEKTNMFLSSAFVDQEGTMIETGFKRWNNNLTVNHKLSNKTKINTRLNYTNTKRIGPLIRYDRSSQILRDVLYFRPVEPLNPNPNEEVGGYIPGQNDADFNNIFDPVKNLQNTDREDNQHLVRINATLTHRFKRFFNFKSANGYQYRGGDNSVFYGLETNQGRRSENGINGRVNTYRFNTFSSSNTLNYSRKKGRNFISALAGLELVENKVFNTSLSNRNLPTDEFGVSNLDIGTTPTIALTNSSSNRLLSYFGRANINLNKKYLLTATFRADGSSKFQDDNKWGYFPSFSAAWQIGNENFLNNVNWINALKVRAGWGVTGNNRIPNFASFSTMGMTIYNGYLFGDNETYLPGAVQNNWAMPDLKWETTEQTNIGLDYSLLDTRLSGTIDYYYKKTSDLLLRAEMALSTGFDQVNQNIGSVSNEGLEFTINGTIVDLPNFKWTSTFNIATNENKILQLNQGQTDLRTDAQYRWGAEYHYISQVGQPVGMMYGLVFDGLYQAEDFILNPDYQESSAGVGQYLLKEGIPTYGNGVGPGHLKYEDQDGDGLITDDDRVIIGNPYPKHFGGFSNAIKWSNFDLQFLFQWAYDYDVFNANRETFGYPLGQQRFSGLASIADAWTPWNTDTQVATYTSNGDQAFPDEGKRLDSRFIEDASFLRLKTLSIGYQIPKRIASKIGFRQIKINLSGQNLYTWTDYQGYDPEASIRRSALVQNLDYSAYPQSRTYSIGINAKF